MSVVRSYPSTKPRYRSSFWPQALLAALCGALLSAALPAISLWPLGLALVPLFALVARSERIKDAFGLGFFFGLAFFGLYIFWLPQSFTDLFGPISWIIYPPLVLVLASFWGVVTGSSRLLGRRGAGTLWLLPALWILMEWARTQGVFAFPWGALGYLWLDTPVAQLAELGGVYGLSFLTAVLAALLTAPFVVRERVIVWLPPLVAAVLLGLGWLDGLSLLREEVTPATQTALLVQGNTDPLGRTVGLGRDVDVYPELTRQALAGADPVDLVVWPEGVMLDYPNLERFDLEEVRRDIQASAGGAPVVTGGGAVEGNSAYNSVYSLASERVVDRFDKVYLVPFGEAFPLIGPLEGLYRPIFGLFGLGLLNNRTPGGVIETLETPLGTTAAYICYESVFPQVARRMVRDGAEVLINISNDAWFGRGRGAEQHFDMGRMRAIETRRYLLRSGNNGVTAAIDPFGRTLERLPRAEAATLRADYGLSDAVTPYVRYGDVLVLALAVFAAGFLVVRVFPS